MPVYYYANADNEVVGPLHVERLHALYADGTISTTTLVCAEGAESWQAYGVMFVTNNTHIPSPKPKTQPQPSQFFESPPRPRRLLSFILIAAVVLVGSALAATYFYQQQEERRRQDIARAEASKQAEEAKAEAVKIEAMRLEAASKAEAIRLQVQRNKETKAAEDYWNATRLKEVQLERAMAGIADDGPNAEAKVKVISGQKTDALMKAAVAARTLAEAEANYVAARGGDSEDAARTKYEEARVKAAGAGVAGRSEATIATELAIEQENLATQLQRVRIKQAEVQARVDAAQRKLNTEIMTAQLAIDRASGKAPAQTEAAIREKESEAEIAAEERALTAARQKEAAEKALVANQTVDLALKATGLSDVKALRAALDGLDSKTIDLALKATGLSDAKALHELLAATEKRHLELKK
jgi:hypothetical protein